MPSQIQKPSISEVLQNALGLQSRVAPLVDDVLVPVLSIGDASLAGFHAKTRAGSAQFYLAAAALNMGTAQFHCPPGMIALITHVWAATTAATSLNIAFRENAAPLGNVAAKSMTDQRYIQEGVTPSCTLTYDDQLAAIANAEWQVRMEVQGAAGTAIVDHYPINWVIGSGVPGITRSLGFQVGAVDQAVFFCLEWVEFIL